LTGRRIRKALGLSSTEAELLLGRARGRIGQRGYPLRIAAFAIATTPLLRRLIPRSARARLIAPLVHALLAGPAENLLYTDATAGRNHG
jgi:hypothetical protein